MTTRCRQLAAILRGLTSGEAPLPPPFPRILCFPPTASRELARLVSALLSKQPLELSKVELRYLLFKIADWHRKRGRLDWIAAGVELERIWIPILHALQTKPTWLQSRAGVGWALRNHEQWRVALTKHARRHHVEPPRVADVWFDGCKLVELTNAAHIFAEGDRVGNCMSSSINKSELARRGFPAADTVAARECLTYAIKVRSGELRLFSLRSPDNFSAATIAYELQRARVQAFALNPSIESALDETWSIIECAALAALSQVLAISAPLPPTKRISCRPDCPGNGWCLRHFEPRFRAPCGLSFRDIPRAEHPEEWELRALQELVAYLEHKQHLAVMRGEPFDT